MGLEKRKTVCFVDMAGLVTAPLRTGEYRDYLKERKIQVIDIRYAGIKDALNRSGSNYSHANSALRSADVVVSLLEQAADLESELKGMKLKVPVLAMRELMGTPKNFDNAYGFITQYVLGRGN